MIGKNNKIKGLLLTITIIATFACKNVQAFQLKIEKGYELQGVTPITAYYDDSESLVKSYVFTAEHLDGSNLTSAYCLDPGYHLGTNAILDCEPSTEGGVNYLLAHKYDSQYCAIGADQRQCVHFALRFYATLTKRTKNPKNTVGKAINAYIQSRYFDKTNDYRNYLKGSGNVLSRAYNLAVAAYSHRGSSNNRGAKLDFRELSSTENKIKISVSSNVSISDVKFTCGNTCKIIENESTWNGTNGTLVIEIKEPNCSYTINAYYGASGTFMCKSSGQNFYVDNVVINYEDEIKSGGKPTQKYTGRITASNGGEYYQKYCKYTPDNKVCYEENGKFYGINGTEVSEEQYRKECDNAPEPVTCTEKTTIEKPEYCDDSKDQYITITSPKNVKYCILNNKDDAGNTYKATNVIPETNPYCSVYCKEDYKIAMPGAQYANSGRYFSLKNTAVNGTKSCYVTGTDGNNGIDLAKYRTNVINAQTKLKDEFNAYSRQKAIYEASQHPIAENISNCEGHSTGTKYIIPANSVQYTYFDIVCNGNNGVCSITSKTRTVTEEISWGTYGGTHDRPYDCSTLTEPNKTCHGCGDDPVTTHGSAPTAPSTQGMMYAQQALEGVIRNLQQCYNFDVNFCIDPTIDFDYNESYSSDIKFEKVSEKAEDIQSSYGTTIDNEYNTSGTSTLTNIGYIKCDTAGCRNGETPATNISNSVTYVKKVQNKTAEYNNTQEFQTNYPSGSIETLPPGSDVKHNYSYLGAVFPIALNTSRGVYKWTLNFTGMGQYNDSNSCKSGRLDEALKANNQEISTGIEYVCVYVVSCDDCDYECVGEGCLIPDQPKCPECDVYCENCIFDGNMTYVYQAKSLNELSVHGSNWTTEKGIATKQEIETNGENIYIEEQYTYRLTPDMMKNLRDYNKEKGNYVPDDLSYHELNGVKNAYGTSDFLRNEKNENKYFKTIKRNEVWTLWEKIGDNMGRSWK